MAVDKAEGAEEDRSKLLRLHTPLPWKMTTKRCWWRAARSFLWRTARTGTMHRTTNRTSTAPMAFRPRRATPEAAGRAEPADNGGLAGQVAEIAGRADGGGAVEGVPVAAAVAVRAAAEIANAAGLYLRQIK